MSYLKEGIVYAIKALQLFCNLVLILDDINQENNFVPFYDFYNEAIENAIDIKEEYPKWKNKEG